MKGRGENMRCIMDDDCETSAHLAMTALNTLLKAHGQSLSELCKEYPLFKQWTATDWALMQGFMDEMTGLVRSGSLSLHTATGLATSMAASDNPSQNVSYNGHCHNIGVLKQAPAHANTMGGAVDQPGESVTCFIVEGTAPLEHCRVTATSSRVTCKAARNGAFVEETIPMPDFLCKLGRTVVVLAQMINAPNGGQFSGGGWPLPEKVSGWMTSTVYTNSLESDRTAKLGFYNRVMYSGLKCRDDGLGCMPVEEQAGGRLAGCHPYDLSRMDLRGVNATLPDGVREKMTAILDEANPPMADEGVFKLLADTWLAAQPLTQMNMDAVGMKAKGVKYLVVSCMESPGSQDYLPIMHLAKTRLANEVNRLNAADPESDGAFLVSALDGTSHALKVYFPDRTTPKVTIVRNFITAMKNIEWPGQIPDGVPH